MSAAHSRALAMVQGQIAPQGVTDEHVLQAFVQVDRAAYLPPAQAALAYIDRAVTDGAGQVVLPRPMLAAQMVQSVMRARPQHVAVLGDAAGYMRDVLIAAGCKDTQAFADAAAFTPRADGWDVILMIHAVPSFPAEWQQHLSPKGQICALVQPIGAPIGWLVMGQSESAARPIAQDVVV